jgi:hypothetical protein
MASAAMEHRRKVAGHVRFFLNPLHLRNLSEFLRKGAG